MDSAIIAAKLESLHPEPSLHLDADLHNEAQAVMYRVFGPLFPTLMPSIRDKLITPHALAYWTRTRESLFGMSIDEFARVKGGPHAWEAAQPGFSELNKFVTEHRRDDGPFILGSQVSYGDFVVVGNLESFRKTDEDMFNMVLGQDERVRELYEACEEWLEHDR